MARKILLALAGVLVLLLLALTVLVTVVDPNDYKPQIQQKAAEQGIDLVMAGDIHWSFFPRLGFALSDLDAQLPAGTAKQPVHIGELTIALGVANLLRGNMAFSAIELKGAATQVALADGKSLGISDINLQARHLNTVGDAFPLSLSFKLVQDALQVDVVLDTQASANLSVGQFGLQQLDMQVNATGASLPGGKQDAHLQLASLQFDRTAETVAVDGLQLGVNGAQLSAGVRGQQLMQAANVVLDPLVIALQDNATLAGRVQWQQGMPGQVMLDIKGDRLDVDALRTRFAPPVAKGAEKPAAVPAQAKKADGSKPEERLPLEGIFAVAGEYQIKLDALVANHLLLTNVILSASVKDRVLTVRELSADAYAGKISNTGSLVFSNPDKPQLKLDTSIKGLQLSPFLNDLQQAPSKVAAGSLMLDAHLMTVPRTEAHLLKTLSGNAQVSVDGLVIDEMNLEQRACEAAAQLSGKGVPAKQWPPKTAVREASAKAQISNGVVMLLPLQAQLDNMVLTGQGAVNLVDSTLDVPLDLVLAGNSSAENFCPVMNENLADVEWPLRCRGNYATQGGKELCGIDKSRLDKLILQAATKKAEGKFGEKLKGAFKGLFD